ncbi:MAG: 3-methyladenine DNA glycosylase AlkC [Flavobacteriales bacterium]|jgi:3-methyladenine DNA glycosylase AlkC
MSQRAMKDGLDKVACERIAQGLSAVDPGFLAKQFITQSWPAISTLELKERVNFLIEHINQCWPATVSARAKSLLQLPKHWDYGNPDDNLRGFAAWPVIDFLAVHGLSSPKSSLPALATLTPLFSSEFAIRPFIEGDEQVVWDHLDTWLLDPSEHVRRLVSEGLRPRLPWGLQLKAFVENPKKILPYLSKLRYDESLYVRRSVANNLNDIAKDHQQTVIDLCLSWQSQAKSESKERQDRVNWIITHATRVLVKQGNPASFVLLGYSVDPKIEIKNFKLKRESLSIGESLEFSLDLLAQKNSQKFVVDYRVYFKKSNGELSPKVFKLKNMHMNKGESESIVKKHSFKVISTRKYYTGKHSLAIQINGQEQAILDFTLNPAY